MGHGRCYREKIRRDETKVSASNIDVHVEGEVKLMVFHRF